MGIVWELLDCLGGEGAMTKLRREFHPAFILVVAD
jgi:hypothetical protein